MKSRTCANIGVSDRKRIGALCRCPSGKAVGKTSARLEQKIYDIDIAD